MTIDRQQFEKGLEIRKQLGMHVQPGPNVDDDFFAMTASDLFGAVFTRPGLDLRDREVITLAVIIAIGGSHENLSNHFRSVRALGFADQEIKEIIIQAMFFAGWPRGAAASRIYNRVKRDAGEAGATRTEGAATEAAKPNPASLREAGLRVRRQLGYAEPAEAAIDDRDFHDLTVAALHGAVFTRPGLPLRDREMIALAAVIALGGGPDLLTEHFRAARAAGFGDDAIREIIVQSMYYSGWPRGAAASQVFNKMKAAEAKT